MRRPTPEPIEAGGQDSFVDVVTNLVGIMIVLVLIVGVRVKHVWLKGAAPETAPPAAKASLTEKQQQASLSELAATAEALEHDVHEISGQVDEVEQELSQRGAERAQLATLISAGEHAVGEARSKLDSTGQEDFDLRRQAETLQQQLEQSRQTLRAVETAPSRAVEVKHYLTPISRTVFGKEQHFRLSEGRIAYVPLADLAERVKSDIRHEASETSNPAILAERKHTVGPIDGFELHYTLEVLSDGPGRASLKLDEFQVLPAASVVGETVAEALKPMSEFRRRLSLMVPRDTTITIWVFPDSFKEFRTLRDELYRQGFAIAARPLPEGLNIAGSERGTRSAAQ